MRHGSALLFVVQATSMEMVEVRLRLQSYGEVRVTTAKSISLMVPMVTCFTHSFHRMKSLTHRVRLFSLMKVISMAMAILTL